MAYNGACNKRRATQRPAQPPRNAVHIRTRRETMASEYDPRRSPVRNAPTHRPSRIVPPNNPLRENSTSSVARSNRKPVLSPSRARFPTDCPRPRSDRCPSGLSAAAGSFSTQPVYGPCLVVALSPSVFPSNRMLRFTARGGHYRRRVGGPPFSYVTLLIGDGENSDAFYAPNKYITINKVPGEVDESPRSAHSLRSHR